MKTRALTNKQIDLFLTLRYVPLSKKAPRRYSRHNYNFKTFIKKSRRIFLNNIKKEIKGEKKVALFLSGGVDSSAVLAGLSMFNVKIKTYTLGFSKNDPDLQLARKLSKYYKTEHKEIILREFPKQIFERCIKNMELPNGDPTVIPVRILTEQVKGVKKIFVGEGGDEVFGGYPEFRYIALSKYFELYPNFIKNIFSNFASEEIKERYNKFFKYLNNPSKSFLYLKSVFTPEEKEKLYTDNFKVNIEDGAVFNFKKKLSFLENVIVFYLENQLPSRLITKYPKESGFQFCFPMLDKRLIDLMLFAPRKYKFNLINGKDKKVLRKIMEPELPAFIHKVKKRGFIVPVKKWMDGSLKKEVKKVLNKEKIENEGRFNWNFVQKVLTSYKKNFYWRNKLWTLFVLEKWLKEKK